MSTDDFLWYANLVNVLAIIASLLASFWLWRLTLRQETGVDHPRLRRLAGRLQFTFMAIAAAATISLWRYSIAATKEADARIAEARSTADSARLESRQALSEQERLKVRGAEIELELMKLQPRSLSASQKNKIIASIRDETDKPRIYFDINTDPEARDYALDISKAFVDAGAQVEERNIMIGGGGDGLIISDKTGVLQRALRSAGIVFVEQKLDSDDAQTVIYVAPRSKK